MEELSHLDTGAWGGDTFFRTAWMMEDTVKQSSFDLHSSCSCVVSGFPTSRFPFPTWLSFCFQLLMLGLCCYHSHLCVSVPPVSLPKPASWILTPLDLSLCRRLGCTTGILWMVSSIHSSLSGGLAHSASETYKFWSNFKCTSQKSVFCPSPKIYFCPQQTFVSSLVWLFPCISGGQAPFFTIYLLQFYMFN